MSEPVPTLSNKLSVWQEAKQSFWSEAVIFCCWYFSNPNATANTPTSVRSECAHVQQTSNTVVISWSSAAGLCVFFSLMISSALSPSTVADFHLASFVIIQMWGSVLHGQLTQSLHWIFLNPPLKLADPMLAHLDAHRDLYLYQRLRHSSCRLLLSAWDKTASSDMTTFAIEIPIWTFHPYIYLKLCGNHILSAFSSNCFSFLDEGNMCSVMCFF